MKLAVFLTIALILINVITCYKGIFQEDAQDLNNYLEEEVERIVKKNFRAFHKRSEAKSEIYEGSGDYQTNIVRKPAKPSNGLKGRVQASMYSNDNDFEFFDFENDTKTNIHIEETTQPNLSTTFLSSTTISTSKAPKSTTQTKPSLPLTTTSTKSTKSPDCNKNTCDHTWANYTAVINPKHITTIEGSNYELTCILRNDETKNFSLPAGSKVVWAVNLNEDNDKLDSYYKIPEKLGPEYNGTENQMVLFKNVTETNSGAYFCVILLPDKCCEKKKLALVRVYKKPDYALHLIITGAICGVQLIACIPFALYTRRRMYTQHKLNNAETEDEQKLIA